MFLQQRGITYQTRRYHSTNIASCSTHGHTHHCYQQLICIVSLFSTSFRYSCCHCSRCAPVPNQPCAPFPTHYSLYTYIITATCQSGLRPVGTAGAERRDTFRQAWLLGGILPLQQRESEPSGTRGDAHGRRSVSAPSCDFGRTYRLHVQGG